MKQALCVFLALVLLVSVGMPAAFAQIGDAADQVELRETALYGDRAMLDGVSAVLPTHFERQAFWDTTVSFGAEDMQLQTDYRFSQNRIRASREEASYGVSIYIALENGFHSSSTVSGAEPDFPDYGLNRAYRELFEATQPGEERSTVVYLKDYMEYYPLQIDLNFPDCGKFFFSESEWMESDDQAKENELEPMGHFRDFFRIPVHANEHIKISVGKNSSGGHYSTGTSSLDGERFWMYTFNAMTDQACYFTFDTHVEQSDEIVDTSLIPGCYGIYRLPYDKQEETQDSEGVIRRRGEPFPIHTEELAMVYPLDSAVRILQLQSDEENGQLLLHTVENDRYILTVIDIATMQTLQRIDVAPYPVDSYTWRIYENDGFFTVLLNGFIAVLAPEDGQYRVELMAETETLEQYVMLGYMMDESVSMAFDGERLVIAAWAPNVHYGNEGCDIFLAVFAEDALQYFGEYRSSLGVGQSGNPCLPNGQIVLSIPKHAE